MNQRQHELLRSCLSQLVPGRESRCLLLHGCEPASGRILLPTDARQSSGPNEMSRLRTTRQEWPRHVCKSTPLVHHWVRTRVSYFTRFRDVWTVCGALSTRLLGDFCKNTKAFPCVFHCFGPVFGPIRPRQAKHCGAVRLFGQNQRVTVGQRGGTVILRSEIEITGAVVWVWWHMHQTLLTDRWSQARSSHTRLETSRGFRPGDTHTTRNPSLSFTWCVFPPPGGLSRACARVSGCRSLSRPGVRQR